MKKNRKLWLIVLTVIALPILLDIALGIMWMSHGDDPPDKRGSQQATPSATKQP